MNACGVVGAVAVVACRPRRRGAGSFQIGTPSLPPVAAERPARQRLAGIPLALAEVQQAARGEAIAQPAQQRRRPGAAWSARARRCSTPRRRGRRCETNVGSPPIVRRTSPASQVASIALAERVDRLPLLVGVRLGDARRLRRCASTVIAKRKSVADLVVVVPLLRPGERPADRAPRLRVGGAGERDVPFAGEQPGGRVEADPAGAGQIDLGPGVQVGEVARPGPTGRRAASRRPSSWIR